MSGAKEIRTKIKSVQNTQKITSAMEMVAASKMRSAQTRMEEARPYSDKIRNVIGHLAKADPEYRHPFMVEREVKRVGFVVITSDRGLCGGLNSNLFRMLLPKLRECEQQGIDVDICAIGNKGLQFISRLRTNLVAQATHLGDRPHISDLIGTLKVMLDAYRNGELDQLVLVYNRFINTMTQEPRAETLLPLGAMEYEEEAGSDQVGHAWDYIYEPGAEQVLDELLQRYVESLVYQAVVDNIASEQAARMVAMKSASDNAEAMIDDLQLVYNKARQAAITTELTEIVSGAAAV